MKITEYHAKYFAYELTKRCSSDSLEKLTSSLIDAQVDLNPHQIEAALFAFRSPLSKGAILADEVGLGKTIEAGLILSQKWAERKRKILLIVPSNLRKQWSQELSDKFFLPSVILESKSFNDTVKGGNLNPFEQEGIIICSYQFARVKSPYIKKIDWDICVIDEAHRLRNVYKTSNKIAKEIKEAVSSVPKILLTATPLQNSLLELYGLVSIIDEHVFGDLKSFKENFARVSQVQDLYENELGFVEPKTEKFADLKERLKPICIRTLRRQVLEYIKYTNRIPLTQDYYPTDDEVSLYNQMSDYLMRPKLYVLPNSQRQLITLILRKLLASSSFAIASTINGLIYKLDRKIQEAEKTKVVKDLGIEGLEENFEAFNEMSDEWVDVEEDDETEESEKDIVEYTEEDIKGMQEEKKTLETCSELAKKIWKNSKGDALLTALSKGFEMAVDLGAKKKAIIFTESRITQDYLLKLLSENGYQDKIVLFNGTNNDQKSKDIYKVWFEKHKDTDKVSGSKTADMRAALIDYFKNEAEIMIATEAGAEGVNLQFCSLLINYDLPWNPQRIEQRIGRCHRYGQKYDVVVINFINRKNAADQRIYELLDQKFNLFKGVFGASDEVLGTIESGMDFEKRIAKIYQTCRTEEDINNSFDELQKEMESSITDNMQDTRQKLLENFDTEVHEKLRMNLKESQAYLDKYENWLWEITKYFLGDYGEYADGEYSFKLKKNPFADEAIDEGPYRIGKNIEDSHIYRPGHPLAQRILSEIKLKPLLQSEIKFDYTNHQTIISALKPYVGKSGSIKLANLSVNTFEPEDYLVCVGKTSDGEDMPVEVIKKLFDLSAEVSEGTSSDVVNLDNLAEQEIVGITTQIAERNSLFFDQEVEKLDKWAEDMKKSLELDLRKLDIDIKVQKTNAKKILTLAEKLAMQKEIKNQEKKRNDMRKRLFDLQDQVEKQKEELIERVEKRLAQQINKEELFTVKWSVI